MVSGGAVGCNADIGHSPTKRTAKDTNARPSDQGSVLVVVVVFALKSALASV